MGSVTKRTLLLIASVSLIVSIVASSGAITTVEASGTSSVSAGWQAAELLETASGYAFGPQIAMDDDGDAMAVWSQFEGSYYNLYAAKYWSSNNTWGTAKLLESLSGAVDSPQIAMDDDGDAMAVWQQYDGSVNSIYAAKYWSSNNTWGTAKLLETASGYAYSPQIAMDDEGDAMAVWRQNDGSADSIYAAKYWSSNNTWSVRILLETTDERASNPQIAMDDDGDAMAVWQQGDSSYSIYAVVYSDGVWSTATLLESLSGAADSPQIAMDDEGDAMAVWSQYDGSYYSIYAAKYWSSNDIWETATLLETASGYAYSPQIAMDDDGDAIAVWQQDDSIYAAVYINPAKLTITSPSDGSTVTTPSVRINGTTNPSASVVVNGYVVYVDDDGNFSVVLALEEGKNIITVTAINETLDLTTSVSIVITYENEMQDEIDDLKENATEQQELIAALQARLTAAEAAISATNAWLSSVSDTLEECYDAQNATADEVADMLVEVQTMKASLVSLRASLNDTNGALISTDANVTGLADDLDDTIASLTTIESNLQAQIDATNVRIGEVYDALNGTKAWLSLVSDTLEACYDAENATADEVAEMLENITSMKTELVTLRASLNDTNGALISTDANVTNLADDLDNIIAELTSAETTLSSVQSSLTTTESDVSSLQSDSLPLMLGVLGMIFGLAAIGLILFVNIRKPKTKAP